LVIESLTTCRSYLLVTLALPLIHTLCSSLQHVLSLFSWLRLYQSLPDKGFRRWTVPLLPVLLTATELHFSNAPINSSFPCTALTLIHCSAYNMQAETAQKTPLLCCCSHSCMRIHWREPHRKHNSSVADNKALHSNSCCLIACFTIFA
jgi:hypothetical protein